MTPRVTVAELAGRARRLLEAAAGARVIVGIVGSPGSGKSTLAQALHQALEQALGGVGGGEVAYVPMDGFHLADVELARLGLAGRKGAPATFDAAGYVALLRRLRDDADEIVYAPAFERTLEQPVAGSIPVPRAARLVITEGNYLLLDGAWAGVRPLLDEVWFARTDHTLRRERLLARHVRFGRTPEQAAAWMAGNDDLNAAVVEQTATRADLVVDLG
jgi:pantothenate kinase